MATDIARITNAALAKLIDSASEQMGAAVANVLRHHSHYEERFLEVLERLDPSHIDVQVYKNLNAKTTNLEAEAYMRVGYATFRSHYPTMLRNSPRYRRLR